MKFAISILILLGFGCTAAQPPPPAVIKAPAEEPAPPAKPVLVQISAARLLANASFSPEGLPEALYKGADAEFCYFILPLSESHHLPVKIARSEVVLHSGLEHLDVEVERGRPVRLDRQGSLHLWAIRDPLQPRKSLDRFLDQSLPAAIQGFVPAGSEEKAEKN
ncbi:MAG: hypothetical protein RL095_3054 [Verrucomicrobiota bacterium]|jgi:hypothetical protein